jgi:transcription elongation factor GreA
MDTKKVEVTQEGFARLSAELLELVEIKRPNIIAAVAEARSHGDLRENAAYDAARQDQAMIEKRIAELEGMLRNVKVLDANSGHDGSGIVRVGSLVTVDFDGEDEQYKIVGAIEAKPTEGMISNESPIGRALIGKKVGDRTIVQTPGGQISLTVKAVE